jgi:hypothetical protein
VGLTFPITPPVFIPENLPSVLVEPPSPPPTVLTQALSPSQLNTRDGTLFSSPSSSEPLSNTLVEPGCRESEVDDSMLSVVLDSLIPFIRDSNDTLLLPTYLGKAILEPSMGNGTSTPLKHPERVGKEFSWSRGIGIEHSPIKTRSLRKKLAGLSKQSIDTVLPSTDSGALRAMKSLARAK